MNVSTRLKAVEQERSKRCACCGGPLVSAPPRLVTWRTVIADIRSLPDAEVVAMSAALNRMADLPPALQERAHRLYCKQQGIEYDGRSMPYSSPNPPPAPWFPESGPAPALPPRWRD